ncbi:diacylglycerol/lipid kinase family protein [Mycetocola zhadangensis]|uniref:diacylglycerol/lipid kinase family protein n=1 Tax=Mycetocola zhadangensis TaxID=1164595 RepID=UPI003A4DB038
MSTENSDSSAPKFAAVIYNPVKVDIDAIREAAGREASDAGWAETRYYETSVDDPGTEVTREALDDGAGMIIAAGGDGTVRAVAEAMSGSGVPIALLPSGTGNLLARNLNLTLDDLNHSLHSAFSGKNRPIDLAKIDIERDGGKIDHHAYLVMAGLGLDAKMLANTDEELKAKVGWLAYVGAIGKALTDKNYLRMRYQLGSDKPKAVRAHTIIMGNCGSLMANVVLLPDAAVDDGELDIIVLRPEGIIGWIQIFVKVIWENGVLRRTKLGEKLVSKDVKALNYFRGEKLTVRLSRAEPIELDGDEFGEATALKTWVEPGGLLVRVPADA